MATYTGTRQSSSRRQLVVVGLAALAVGLGAGLGAARIDLHGHSSSPAGVAAPVASAGGGISRADAMGGAAEFLRDHPQAQPPGGEVNSRPATTSSGTTAATAPFLYLVDSAAQAEAVQQRLDQVAVSWQPLDATVLTVASEMSPDEVGWLLTSLNAARGMQGLAPLTLVDLRISDTTAPAQPAPPSCPVEGFNAGSC